MRCSSCQRRVRGLALLLDWLAAQPGETWQDRWLASSADRPCAGGRQLPIGVALRHQAQGIYCLEAAAKLLIARRKPGWRCHEES